MATASIDPLHFFIQVQPSLLKQYAASYDLTFNTQHEAPSEEAAEEFMQFLHALPEETQKNIWSDFYYIDSIASKTGCEYLLDHAIKQGKAPDKNVFPNLRNDKERAIYFHLHHNDIFSTVTVEYNIDNLQGWRTEKTVKKTIEEVIDNVSSFEAALKAFYNKEYRGNRIKIRTTTKPDRTIFSAYIEDAYTSEVLFKKDNNLNSKAVRRPVFTVHFLYRAEEGTLGIKAPGGIKKLHNLQSLFIQYMLEEKPVLQSAVQFDFEKIKTLAALTLPLYDTDGVDHVTLCGLRLVDNNTKATHAIDIGDHNSHGTEPMALILREKNIDLKDYRVTQFKFLVVFQKETKGRARQVTVKVSYPNICDLKERPIDYVVRELLKRWGLALY